MVELTSHDIGILSRLIRGRNLLSDDVRQKISAELESSEAKAVGEAVLDPERYSTSDTAVKDTVDHLSKWLEANKRIAQSRQSRKRAMRSR